MEFNYNLSRRDYKKMIYERNNRTTFIYIIIMSIVFLLGTINFLVDNTLLIFILYIIFCLLMVFILFILNKLITILFVKYNEKHLNIKYGIYHLKLTKDKIIETIDDVKQEIEFNNIKNINYKKDSIIIYPNNKRIMVVFKKQLFEKGQEFDKLVKYLKEKVIIKK